MTEALEPPDGQDDLPPLRPRPLSAYGGPMDGGDVVVSPDGHTWVLDTPAAPGRYRELLGDTALRTHWATALALGDPVGGPRPDAGAALRALAGVYVLDAACELAWCALQPPPRGPTRPAGRWQLRALLTWWEAASLLEAHQLLGTLPEIVAVREAWRGERGVQARAFAVARTVYYHRYPRRPRGGDDGVGPSLGR